MTEQSESEALRLHWRQTWPERDADYCAEVEGFDDAVGRICMDKDGPLSGVWFWAMTADGPEVSRNVGEMHGTAQSPREAARLMEAAWFEAIRGTSHERVAPRANAYASAKAR